MIRALSFGEILWDIIQGEAHIGGAPFNLAAHLVKMGAKAGIISSLGTDDLGERALAGVKDLGIDPRFITVQDAYPTGTVDVFLDDQGHPDYTIHTDTAWDNLSVSEDDLRVITAESWDVFCFGTLAQRSEKNRQLLLSVLTGIDAGHIFYDMNLRQRYYRKDWIERSLDFTTILKLNDDEAASVAEMFVMPSIKTEDDQRSFAHALALHHDLDVVILTRGNDGAMAYAGGEVYESSCGDVEVVDTVGAGDSFSAGFLTAYLSGAEVSVATEFASGIADFVVSQRGAIPDYTQEQKDALKSLTGHTP